MLDNVEDRLAAGENLILALMNHLVFSKGGWIFPFANRTAKTLAWAKLKHNKVPAKLPCGDNCPVSINWHVNTDHKAGWTARIMIFNWLDDSFEDWFAAIKFDKYFEDFEDVYSFNGTRILGLKTIFLQGLKDMNYLAGETNGTCPSDPRVLEKQQSVISFNKKNTKHIDIMRNGFPS
ncbi:hypothetical protein RIF29_21528 [Crotalaria pallida]|uniref:COBRA C-terminal domain-containing protein n=1 Tax=Crotalaria pallida TaxID=3830 RepID=A0AAN9F4X1_CROPI